MIQVRLLTLEQKSLLVNMQYVDGINFFPIQDIHNNWIISEEEVTNCTHIGCQWVKDLPLIDWEPVIEEVP